MELSSKPNCSYTCMIGMALGASRTGRMNVAEMYSFIRNKFPYYRNSCSTTWKNSVRHSLSLSRNFRRVGFGADMHMRKGLQWEVIPERRDVVDREIKLYSRSNAEETALIGKVLGQCSFLVLASNHPTQPQGHLQSTSTATLTQPQGHKSPSVLYGGLKYNPSKQDLGISQCQNIAKILASQNKLLSSADQGTGCPGITPTSNDRACPSKKLANASRNATTTKRSTQLKTQSKKKGLHIGPPCQDHMYVDKLLATVDKAITMEYGWADNTQMLTFDEIFDALQEVHKKYRHRRQGKAEIVETKRDGRSVCVHGASLGEEMEVRTEVSSDILTSSSSFWCAFEATPITTAGGVGGATEQDVELLLSKSEEKMLLRDLEMDARKMTLNSRSYLRCGGETVSSCLATKQLG